jgi:acetyltransferase-like isoleucine patch superfamily enzyme
LDNVHIANNVFINEGIVLRLFGDCQLFVGENTHIGPHSHISGIQGSIIIGKRVLIADFVYITTASYKYEDVTKSVKDQGQESRGNVIIGDGCWIGVGSCIMSGVEVGRNSVIGANSVVTHDIPPNSVAAGSPARVIRQYSPTEKKWLDR